MAEMDLRLVVRRITFVLLPLILVHLTACATPRAIQPHDPRSVRQIGVSYCRDRVKQEWEGMVLSDRDKIDAILESLNKYQQGWKEVLVTPPVGVLAISCMGEGNANPAEYEWPLADYRFTPRGIMTLVDGKWHAQDISETDQRELCRLIGLEESFFRREEQEKKGW